MRQIEQSKADGYPPFLSVNELLQSAKKDKGKAKRAEWSYRNGYFTGWLHCARAIVRLYRKGYVRPRDIASLLESHDADLRHWRDAVETEDPIAMGEPPFRRPTWEQLRQHVFDRDGGLCRKCGSAHNLEAHHVDPVAEGGVSDTYNLVALCRKCHRGF
jgi:hypothetical protein